MSENKESDLSDFLFLGGLPTPTSDLLASLIFLVLFSIGAFTHISINRANSKKNHKFFISKMLFNFCLLRILSCTFRITWAFVNTRGVALAAVLFQNGGAVVIFAVNLIFAQRLVRAMHPFFGWSPAFGYFSWFLLLSIPVVTIMNLTAICVKFFGGDDPERKKVAGEFLKFGSSWNTMLVLMPLIWVFLASAAPGPPFEKFGRGEIRSKAALLIFSAVMMAAGAILRLTAAVNRDVNPSSPLLSRTVFYLTGFTLELLTVAAYAYFRVDLLFYIPTGAKGPGDYSVLSGSNGLGPFVRTIGDIEREIAKIGVPYQCLTPHVWNKPDALVVVLYASRKHHGATNKDQSPIFQNYDDVILSSQAHYETELEETVVNATQLSRHGTADTGRKTYNDRSNLLNKYYTSWENRV